MLKYQLFAVILTLFIMGIIFQGTHAHEDPVVGEHSEIVGGYAWAVVYGDLLALPPTWKAFASSNVSAVDEIDPDKTIDGMYVVRAHAGKWGLTMHVDQKAGYFVGDLYEYATNSAEQSGPQGLWSQGDGDAHGYRYDIKRFLDVDTNEVIELWVRTHHDEHDPPWLEMAP